jgi:aminoglycoside phosphotransferase (APT) family kinase protein
VGIAGEKLSTALARVCARAGLGALSDAPQRLTGGAMMESWRFAAGGKPYVLRRAPSLAFMQGRPYGHATEAALIEAARARGVTAPEVVAVLEEADGLGSGFIMRALPGTADPRTAARDRARSCPHPFPAPRRCARGRAGDRLPRRDCRA